MLTETADGLYRPAGNFHIDPGRPVPLALITHAHGDRGLDVADGPEALPGSRL